MAKLTVVEAINLALRQEMEKDPEKGGFKTRPYKSPLQPPADQFFGGSAGMMVTYASN